MTNQRCYTVTVKNTTPRYTLVCRAGLAGKSAYQAAREGGYEGTEAEFNELLARGVSSGAGGITRETDPVYTADKPQLAASFASCAKSADVAAALEAERRARQTAIDNAITAAIDDTWEGSY